MPRHFPALLICGPNPKGAPLGLSFDPRGVLRTAQERFVEEPFLHRTRALGAFHEVLAPTRRTVYSRSIESIQRTSSSSVSRSRYWWPISGISRNITEYLLSTSLFLLSAMGLASGSLPLST